MRDRNETHLDHLGDQNDHEAGYRYDEIHDAQCPERIDHLQRQPSRAQVQQLPSALQSQQARRLHTLQDSQQDLALDVEVRNQP